MPRRQRVHLDDVPSHIVQRAHNREPCFFGHEDCCTYLRLGEALTERGGQLHAYALMRAATVPKRIMSLERRYVQYINTSYRRTGHGMGQPVQAFAYTGRNIPAHLHALYRTPPRSGDDGGGSSALSLDKLSSQRPRTNVAAFSPSLGLPFPWCDRQGTASRLTVTYSGIISTKEWSASCDWRSTKASPSGTSVSMR